jgi:hypothetical protein
VDTACGKSKTELKSGTTAKRIHRKKTVVKVLFKQLAELTKVDLQLATASWLADCPQK